MSGRALAYDALIYNSKIRLIQTARNQIGMNDSSYRAAQISRHKPAPDPDCHQFNEAANEEHHDDR